MPHMLCTGYFYKGGGGFPNYSTTGAYLRGGGFKPSPPKKNSVFFLKSEGKEVERKRG